MRPIRKGGDTPFLRAVAAALFLAACAYVGAALYGLLASLPAPAVPAMAETKPAMTGLALRTETVLDARIDAEDGSRLRGQGVYFQACDGYETLSPSLWETLDAETLTALLAAAPEEAGAARLVTDTVWFYAALLTAGETPEKGPCRLRFAGFDRAVPARLVEVREDKGCTLLLFRLTEGGDYLRIRSIDADIERS